MASASLRAATRMQVSSASAVSRRSSGQGATSTASTAAFALPPRPLSALCGVSRRRTVDEAVSRMPAPVTWGRRSSSSKPLSVAPEAALGASSSANPFDLSGGLLEKCFEVALKNRLDAWQLIDAKVDCNTFGLLGGVLNGFLVRGLGWVTPMGMTVRLFEVSLGETRIDIGNALATQQIAFASTPTGSARLVFNAADFGNLFRHPLMKTLAATAGVIKIAGIWHGDGNRYQIIAEPNEYGRVNVTASLDLPENASAFMDGPPQQSPSASVVANGLGHFFNNLALDLDGPVMTFRSMQVRKGRDAEVIDMMLNLKLMRMPPLDISF
eukprot:jgi/Tetstr1/444198/TSEL_032092.t1